MVRRLGGLDGWVSPPFLPAAPPCTTGFTPLALDRYVPLNQLRASLRETLAVHPLPPATPFRARAAQTSCPPLPNGRRHRFLLLSLATSYSYGSALSVRSDSIFIVPEVDCISVEISVPRKYTSFRGCEIDTHSALANRILKGIRRIGVPHSRARMM